MKIILSCVFFCCSFISASAFQGIGLEEKRDVREESWFKELTASYQFKTMATADGTQLSYSVILPDNYDKDKTYPVLIGFGPGNESEEAARFGLAAFWGQKSAERGWIVIGVVKPSGNWRSTRGTDYLRELLDQMASKYKVRGEKFHFAGCSNGGNSAIYQAQEMPERLHSLTVLPGSPSGSKKRMAHLKGVRVNLLVGALDSGWKSAAVKTNQTLLDLDVRSQIKIYPGEGHVIMTLYRGELMAFLEDFKSLGTP